jgi:chromosome segregation ATPase
VHDQVLQADDAATSHAKKYEQAYVAEYYKLQRASEMNNGMGREIDVLRRDIAKWDARYRELDELNTLIEQRNEDLDDKNMQLEGTIEELKEQIRILKSELCQVGNQPSSWAEEEEQDEVPIHSPAHTIIEDEKDSGLITISSCIASVEPESLESLQTSLKRKHSEVEQGSDEEPRRTRRRK